MKNALATYCQLVWLKTGKENPSKNECKDATSFQNVGVKLALEVTILMKPHSFQKNYLVYL